MAASLWPLSQDDVLATVQGHYDQISATFACANDLQRKTKELRASLAAVVDAVERKPSATGDDGGIESNVVQTALKHQTLSRAVENASRVVGVLDTLANLHDAFLTFDKELDAGRYAKAAALLLSMKEMLSSISDGEGTAEIASAPVVLAAKTQTLRKQARMRTRVSELLATAVSVGDGELTISKGLPGAFGHLHYDRRVSVGDLFQTMSTLGWLDEYLQELAQQLSKCLWAPIVRGATDIDVETRAAQASMRILADEDGGGVSPERVFDLVGKAAAFLRAHLFEGVEALLPLLGNRIWWGDVGGAASDALLDSQQWTGLVETLTSMLQDAVPGTAAELRAFQPVLEAAEALEMQLLTSGFFTTDGGARTGTSESGAAASHGRTLRAFGSNVDAHFAAKKRKDVLVRARRLLVSEHRNTVFVCDATERALLPDGEVGGAAESTLTDVMPAALSESEDAGDRGFFRLPAMHVSASAAALIKLVHSTLEDACSSSSSVAATVLYHTARDSLDMYRAVVPCRFGDTLAAVPHQAMLLHNDAMYIAHHLLTIGHRYRARLPAPLNRVAGTVDLVPPFRALGEQAFVGQVRRQRVQLLEFIVETPGFDRVGDEDAFAAVETGVKRQVYHLNQLAGSWADIMPTVAYFRAMGHLIDTVLDDAMQRVLRLDTITATMAHQLHYLVSLLFDAASVFGVRTTMDAERDRAAGIDEDATEGSRAAPGDAAKRARKYVRNWVKAQRLAEILVSPIAIDFCNICLIRCTCWCVFVWQDLPLATLDERHSEGWLSMWSDAEIASLIRAIFDTSRRRESFLGRLESR